MTKITTDFVGTESTVVTKSRLTQILAYWGASTAGYTLWGQARSALNVRLLNTTAGVIGEEELAGSFLPKINFLNDPDDMVLDALFGAGEQGVWFDPSDVANIYWRRNLLLYTEAFGNALWYDLSTGTTTKTIGQTDPLGGTTAVKLVGNNAATWLGQGIGPISGGPYTFSVWLRSDSAASATLILSYGPGDNTQIVSLTTAWQRFSVTGVRSATAGLFSAINIGNGVPVYAWGAQLETGSVATEYQPITTLNAEIIARFPDATMYQDFSGTTPVYAPNQPVGLRLDKSKGLVPGPELVAPIDFTTGWTFSGSAVTFDDANTYTAAGVANVFRAYFTVGKWYKMEISVTTTGGAILLYNATSATNPIGSASLVNGVAYTFYFYAAATQLNIRTPNAATVNIDNISVKELPGNHATQSTDISRPLYGIEPAGGRRNLLTYSEDQTNAIWSKSLVTVTANAILAPDGISTTDTIIPSTANDFHYLGNAVTVVSATSYVVSFYAKNGGYGFIRFFDGTANNAVYTLSGAGTITDNSGGASTITSVGDGWYRCTKTIITASTTQNIFLYPQNVVGMVAYAGNGTSGVYLWGVQFELNTAATPYQKVVTAFEVTEAGVQTCHYCNYDGTNDGMITNSIDFTATDKISTFAVIRSTSAGAQVVAELSASSSANAGSFLIGSGSFVSGGNRMGGQLAGSTVLGYDSPANFPQPAFLLVSNLYNIAGTTALAEAGLRVNTVVQSPLNAGAAGSAGTGNFGNYRLNLGRRGNDQVTPTLPFNGRDYGIIVTGKLATSAQIGNAENFLLNKLGSLAPVITGVPTIGVN